MPTSPKRITRRCPMASVDDLWLVDFGDPYPGEPAAHRPALILGPPDTFGPGFPFVIVVPLTTVRRGLSLHIEVEASADSGLDTVSYIQCELIRSINRNRLVHRLGAVGPDISNQVSAVIKTLLNH
jgi:mRNA interferase MazF